MKSFKNLSPVITISFAVFALENGYPDLNGVAPALESVGLKAPYSIVINMLTITMDGGKTNSNILAGFAYPDKNQKVIPYPQCEF